MNGEEPRDLAELQPRLDEIRVFASIIPDEIEKELKKAVREKDAKTVKYILDMKVKLIIESYIARLQDSAIPAEGEQILWMHTLTKGIANKEIVARWIITDFRAILSIPQGKYFLGNDTSFPSTAQVVGLEVSDAVVMNQYRSTRGSRVGTFTGVGGRTFVGTGVSSSTSQSQSYGDLVFFIDGKEHFRFQGISDPQGVRRMIETLKKQKRV